MSSLLAARLGAQRPRVSSAPAGDGDMGDRAIRLAAVAGLELDDWQQHILRVAMRERAERSWSAFEVALIVPRQNGKGAVLEARELAGLFLLEDERLILHSAHEFKTAQEAFRRILALVERTSALRRRVARIRTSHGEEGIELTDGSRLRFVARSTGSGRGFSGDLVILDEAYALTAESMAALLPTMSARPNPQLWYASSAGMTSSTQLRAVRERGLAADPSLAYFEWSVADGADLDDPEAWATANPGMGIRIAEEFVGRERAALPEAEFARERLGVWEALRGASVIDADVWHGLTDPLSRPEDPVAFAADATPDRAWASIGLAGRRADGRWHHEVVANERGIGWVAGRLAELQKWRPCATVIDPGGPLGSILPALEEAGVEVATVTAREMAQACGGFYDAVTDGQSRHLGSGVLNAAVDAARKRPLGDAWAWHRKDATTDISPLVAVTLAQFGHARAMAGGWRPPKSRVVYGF